MDEYMVEFEIERMDLGDKMDTFCKTVCSNIKHLAKVIGTEDKGPVLRK